MEEPIGRLPIGRRGTLEAVLFRWYLDFGWPAIDGAVDGFGRLWEDRSR